MTKNELYDGMIKNGLTKNWYSVEFLGFATKIDSQKLTGMLKELANDEKVISRKMENGKLEYKFVAQEGH